MEIKFYHEKEEFDETLGLTQQRGNYLVDLGIVEYLKQKDMAIALENVCKECENEQELTYACYTFGKTAALSPSVAEWMLEGSEYFDAETLEKIN